MAARGKSLYQYETSPRKLEPGYNKNTQKKKKKATNIKKKETKKQNARAVEVTKFTKKINGVLLTILLFGAMFTIAYRNSQIDESFMEVQGLQQELASLQKENEQKRVSIENSFNLSVIEQQAKELLGMQKLENNQREYINVPKVEFIEPLKVVKEKSTWYENIFRFFSNIW